MTIEAMPAVPAAPQQAARRKFTRNSGGAGSMLALGEPMIWLTGAAFVTCVLMIVSLLVWIFAQGMSAFWPVPMVRMELVDGSVVLGEVTHDEPYSFSRDVAAQLSGERGEAAKALLEGREEVQIRRRLVRTGNYELTNNHFQWVSDFEIKPNGESHPKWAIVTERAAWGRFYGEPREFAVRHERPIPADEARLAETVQFFERSAHHLGEPERTAIEPLLAKVREELAAVRTGNLKEFAKQFPAAEDRRIDVILGDGRVISLDEVQPQDAVEQVVEVWTTSEAAWRAYERYHAGARQRATERTYLTKHEIGSVNNRIERGRLAVRQEELRHGVLLVDAATEMRHSLAHSAAIRAEAQMADQQAEGIVERHAADAPLAAAAKQLKEKLRASYGEALAGPAAVIAHWQKEVDAAPPSAREAVAGFVEAARAADEDLAKIQAQIDALTRENSRFELRLVTSDGREKGLVLDDVVRAYPANQLNWTGKVGVYLSRWWEFLSDDPREANSEGGVLPAIVGTVVMTLIMALAVVPFGVLAALYLREYAKAGVMVSAVRIAINNLAGVPSIVFGVFGLGFFCYIIGTYMDGGPDAAGIGAWPPASWYGAIALLAILAVAAFFAGLVGFSSRRGEASTWRRALRSVSLVLWLAATALLFTVIFTSPYFNGFYEARLPNPTYGKGGLIWASLTLALLTLPVVIVSTEEALSAVPNSMREGSYACGASKWQTIWRIVLPHAMPGIMTGMILAMARGAGEVAPLMLVGAVKIAPDMPLDASAPFLHIDRSFMHLGFHVFDLAFQSPNSEAARPLVYTTSLLLIFIIFALNLAAVWLRARLRRQFVGGQF
jgi:phosphate transport system permease protein